jgi:hypothetical protein
MGHTLQVNSCEAKLAISYTTKKLLPGSWCIPVIPTPQSLRQEDIEYEASMDDIHKTVPHILNTEIYH